MGRPPRLSARLAAGECWLRSADLADRVRTKVVETGWYFDMMFLLMGPVLPARHVS
ncbi:MAG: hypothetical protein R2754_06130 [Microthrixaceae bacterium]